MGGAGARERESRPRFRSGGECEFLGFFGLGSRRRFGERRGVGRIGSALRREEEARREHDQAEAEIGREGLHREEEERCDERETQIQGLKPKSWPTASQMPKKVSWREKIFWFSFAIVRSFLLAAVGRPLLPMTKQWACQLVILSIFRAFLHPRSRNVPVFVEIIPINRDNVPIGVIA